MENFAQAQTHRELQLMETGEYGFDSDAHEMANESLARSKATIVHKDDLKLAAAEWQLISQSLR